MTNISIKKIRVFLAAVEEKSFTRAALRENISQPAASIIINQIEEELNTELFMRQGNTRKSQLTPIGVEVAETFSQIMISYNSEIEKAYNIPLGKTKAKELLIQSAYADAISPDWLAAFFAMHNGDHINVRVLDRAGIIELLKERKTNYAIVDGAIEDSRVEQITLLQTNLQLAAHDAKALSTEPGHLEGLNADVVLYHDIDPTGLQRVKAALRKSPAPFSSTDVKILQGQAALISVLTSSERGVVLPAPLAQKIAATNETRFESIDIQPTIGLDVTLALPWGAGSRLDQSILRDISLF
ncbi:LysR family transcriptional regulator [Epibacterium ulvae]|uniref:LysR family transcriptional regulator n=1 Tax=Epibacterium ulvae TaxID=1156985 RepID=UPI002492A3BC|nr:LysR family transcriptional regulator [Epibacterium ulvae]